MAEEHPLPPIGTLVRVKETNFHWAGQLALVHRYEKDEHALDLVRVYLRRLSDGQEGYLIDSALHDYVEIANEEG